MHMWLAFYFFVVAMNCWTVLRSRSDSGNTWADFGLEAAFVFFWPIVVPAMLVIMYVMKKRGRMDEEILMCPECRNGKHINCDGQAYDEVADQMVPCGCAISMGH